MIETTKWSSWVVPVGAQQIQDGRQKSRYLRSGLTDLYEIW